MTAAELNAKADVLIRRFIEEAAAVGIAEPMARKVLALDLDEMELPPTFRAAVKARALRGSDDEGAGVNGDER